MSLLSSSEPTPALQSRGYREFPQHFPQAGWVEHQPDEIWARHLDAAREALARRRDAPTCVGITNQRETVVLWDRDTLASPRPAIVWQDRRTAGMCEQLRQDGHEGRSCAESTGLRLDPYFSATKLAWIRRQRTAGLGRASPRVGRRSAPSTRTSSRA